MKPQRRVEWIGHRGAPRERPENTIQSFRLAFERGADAIELDVHATADGTAVVHHNVTLGTTIEPPRLRGRAIAELRWSDVESVRLDGDARIPLLRDVLAIVPPDATAYVEIKGASIEQLIADTIDRARARCAVHSFDHGAIRTMQRIAPAIPRGLLFESYPADVAGALQVADARDVWPQWQLIDRTLVDAVHSAGGRVIAWTVNAADVAHALVALNVDGICTDDLRAIT